MIIELPPGKIVDLFPSMNFHYLEICHLKLIHFDCSFNRLIHLPLNLRDMVSLIEFNVENNPLESPPTSVNEINEFFLFKNKVCLFFSCQDLYTWFTSYHAFSFDRSNERRKTKRLIN
jgi:hypothetical protein